MTRHPLLERLVRETGATWLQLAELDDTVRNGTWALFLVGELDKLPEAQDVAVVLPELVRALPGAFALAVVSEEAEPAVGARFAVRDRPALLFFRDGSYLTAVTGMYDWQPFIAHVTRALSAPPAAVRLPVLTEPAAGSCRTEP